MLIDFDYKTYGFKIKDLYVGDSEAEPHCSIVLKLNNMKKLDEDTFELTRYIPIDGNIELLKNLRKSCTLTIKKLEAVNKKFKEAFQSEKNE